MFTPENIGPSVTKMNVGTANMMRKFKLNLIFEKLCGSLSTSLRRIKFSKD